MNRSISWPDWSTCSSVSWTHFSSDIVTTTTSFLRVSRMFPITAFKKNEQELWPIAVYNTMRNTRKNLVTLNKYGYGWRNKLNQLELHVILIDIAHKHSQIQIWRGLDFGGLRQIWSYFPTDEFFNSNKFIWEGASQTTSMTLQHVHGYTKMWIVILQEKTQFSIQVLESQRAFSWSWRKWVWATRKEWQSIPFLGEWMTLSWESLFQKGNSGSG